MSGKHGLMSGVDFNPLVEFLFQFQNATAFVVQKIERKLHIEFAYQRRRLVGAQAALYFPERLLRLPFHIAPKASAPAQRT